MAPQARGTCTGLGDSCLSQTWLSHAYDFALLLDEPVVEQFFHDTGFELRAEGEVDAVNALDGANAGALEAAPQLPLSSYTSLGAKHIQSEVRIREILTLCAGKLF